MKENQTTCAERPPRQRLLPGAFIALVAVVGVDCATANAAPTPAHRIVPITARSVMPTPQAAILTRTGSLAWCTTALVLLLVFGRSITFISPRRFSSAFVSSVVPTGPVPIPRRKLSISYRTGGLYGP